MCYTDCYLCLYMWHRKRQIVRNTGRHWKREVCCSPVTNPSVYGAFPRTLCSVHIFIVTCFCLGFISVFIPVLPLVYFLIVFTCSLFRSWIIWLSSLSFVKSCQLSSHICAYFPYMYLIMDYPVMKLLSCLWLWWWIYFTFSKKATFFAHLHPASNECMLRPHGILILARRAV